MVECSDISSAIMVTLQENYKSDTCFFFPIVANIDASMAGHNESEKKSNDTSNIQTFNAENLQSNMKIIYYRFVFNLKIY